MATPITLPKQHFKRKRNNPQDKTTIQRYPPSSYLVTHLHFVTPTISHSIRHSYNSSHCVCHTLFVTPSFRHSHNSSHTIRHTLFVRLISSPLRVTPNSSLLHFVTPTTRHTLFVCSTHWVRRNDGVTKLKKFFLNKFSAAFSNQKQIARGD